MQAEETRARELKAIAQRRGHQAQVCTDTAVAATAAVGALVASGAAFPPAILFLPVILPIFTIISSIVECKYSQEAASGYMLHVVGRLAHNMTARDTEALTCADAIEHLHRAATDISVLVQTMDAFNRWWMDVSFSQSDKMPSYVLYKTKHRWIR
jgi:hypothetical protein